MSQSPRARDKYSTPSHTAPATPSSRLNPLAVGVGIQQSLIGIYSHYSGLNPLAVEVGIERGSIRH